MDGLLAGRVAVITGGARGIGGAIVARFAEHGATGLVLDSEAVVAAAKLPEGFAGRAGDVTKEAQLAAVMAEAGRISAASTYWSPMPASCRPGMKPRISISTNGTGYSRSMPAASPRR